jgi:hypothetical protein
MDNVHTQVYLRQFTKAKGFTLTIYTPHYVHSGAWKQLAFAWLGIFKEFKKLLGTTRELDQGRNRHAKKLQEKDGF